MPALISLQLEWDIQQLARLQQALQAHADVQEWDELLLGQINLIAEELVVNVMTHGHEGRNATAAPGWVRIELWEDDGCITLRVVDNGAAYDPTSQSAPDVDAPLDQRDRGGLGVFLVRELADSLQYQYDDGLNVVMVRKRRSAPA